MTAHTPAPWTVQKGAYGAIWAGPAQLPHPGRDSMRLEDRLAQRAADAALIAAAPDMLAALKALSAAFDMDEHDQDRAHAEACAMTDARAAIAKAERRNRTMTAHTPAPWTVQKGAYGAIWAGPAQLPHPGRNSMRLEDRLAQRAADAALIAAAPDMLAALKALLGAEADGFPLPFDHRRAAAIAAIAKAERSAP